MAARSYAGFDKSSTLVKAKDHVITLEGAGVGQPVKTDGPGITVNRTGVGVIDLTWDELPGKYVGLTGFGFEATTPADLKGFTVVSTRFDSATLKVTINVTSNLDALTDLVAGQFLTLQFTFRQSQ